MRNGDRLQVKVPQRIVVTPPITVGVLHKIRIDETGLVEVVDVWGKSWVVGRLEGESDPADST